MRQKKANCLPLKSEFLKKKFLKTELSCLFLILVAWVTPQVQAQNDTIIIFDNDLIKQREYNLYRLQYNPAEALANDTAAVELKDSLFIPQYMVNSLLDSVFGQWFPDGIPTQRFKRQQGYRVLVYRGRYRKEVQAARDLIYKHFDHWRSYLDFKTSSYFLRIGNFEEKSEAEKAQRQLNRYFKDTAIVPARITIWYATYLNGWN
ncbi:MAG TPA: hypothetical protein DCS93_10165 [Microscillaceae bacterium]|nr:hypothetical protein [Microscillaceae bacterium]